jgi:hypothetical protein
LEGHGRGEAEPEELHTLGLPRNFSIMLRGRARPDPQLLPWPTEFAPIRLPPLSKGA